MSDDLKNDQSTDARIESNTIKLWTKRIRDARKFYEKDFKRMKENMEFAAGLQRPTQDSIESTEYTVNFVNREVNQKVATLYAKDPKAVYRRRKRQDFQIWDESVETMQHANMTMMQAQQAAQQNPLAMQAPQIQQAQALLNDINHGHQWRALCDRIGKSMEILYAYECDTQAPDFKYQMKQLVRRVVTTGVGYVRLNFSREGNHSLTSTATDDSLSMRIKRARHIMEGIEDDKITEDDPRRQQLEQLFSSVEASVSMGDQTNIEERLDFDFPSATSLIVDPKCKSLKGFIGARWIAQQYILPLEDVNAYFETKIDAGGELIKYSEDGIEKLKAQPEGASKDPQEKPLCCIWEVFDILTKTSFFLADGWKEYVQEPQPLHPPINRFWPIFTLTFNDVEVEPGGKVHIYPPSDVELIKHPQKELNRQREELKKQRKGNRPWYGVSSGLLTTTDEELLNDHETNQLIPLKGVAPGQKISEVIQRFDATPIDPAMYESKTVLDDAGLVIGSNQSQQGQPQRHVAATPAVIQEQARISGVNSNVDDLDDLLSELARAAGEMMLREFSLQTVKRICGQGAAWPEQNRTDFLNEIYLDSVAASSGRPNKAVDVANWQQIGPLLLQAGANPWGLIKQTVKVLDANLDPEDFAPTLPPQPQGGNPTQKPQQAQRHPGTVGQHLGGVPQPAGV